MSSVAPTAEPVAPVRSTLRITFRDTLSSRLIPLIGFP